jgi:protein TonB
MSTHAASRARQPDHTSSGFAGAIGLHIAIVAAFIAAAYIVPSHNQNWGDKTSSTGAIQASMVAALPLPQKYPPVKDTVLTPDTPSPAPAPPPKEATQAPPKDTDILVKGKVTKTTKPAPTTVEQPPKHPQPTPDTPKAQTGQAAPQIAESVTQLKNGDSAASIEDRAFGARYAYYRDLINRTVSQNWYTAEADPRTSQGKHAVLLIDINRDGVPSNVRIVTHSGSPSLDASALHAIQRIESFGPLPSGDHITVQLSFNYHQP